MLCLVRYHGATVDFGDGLHSGRINDGGPDGHAPGPFLHVLSAESEGDQHQGQACELSPGVAGFNGAPGGAGDGRGGRRGGRVPGEGDPGRLEHLLVVVPFRKEREETESARSEVCCVCGRGYRQQL